MTVQTPPGTAPLPEIVVRRLAAIAVTALVLGALLIGVAVLVAVYGDINKGELVAILASVGVLLNIASGCTGGLGAILASTRTASDPPLPVVATNTAAQPVPTSDVTDDPPAQDPTGPKKRTPRQRTPRKG